MTQPHIPILDIQPLKRKLSYLLAQSLKPTVPNRSALIRAQPRALMRCLLWMLKVWWPTNHIAVPGTRRPDPIEIHLLEGIR